MHLKPLKYQSRSLVSLDEPLHRMEFDLFHRASSLSLHPHCEGKVFDQIRDTMVLAGLSEEEANKRFYTLDYRGLLTEDIEGILDFQKPYLRNADEVKDWKRDEKGQIPFDEVVRQAKPTPEVPIKIVGFA